MHYLSCLWVLQLQNLFDSFFFFLSFSFFGKVVLLFINFIPQPIELPL